MKLVVVEDGSDVVSDLWATAIDAASSILSYPESRAALTAARRVGRLDARSHRLASFELESLQDELLLLGIDIPLAREAGRLAEEQALRGYDAVHLASALALGEETVLVSWDRDQRQAALRYGLSVAPPD